MTPMALRHAHRTPLAYLRCIPYHTPTKTHTHTHSHPLHTAAALLLPNASRANQGARVLLQGLHAHSRGVFGDANAGRMLAVDQSSQNALNTPTGHPQRARRGFLA